MTPQLQTIQPRKCTTCKHSPKHHRGWSDGFTESELGPCQLTNCDCSRYKLPAIQRQEPRKLICGCTEFKPCADHSRRDYVREFNEAADRILNKLADDLEEIDRRNGIPVHDYSVLRGESEIAVTEVQWNETKTRKEILDGMREFDFVKTGIKGQELLEKMSKALALVEANNEQHITP